jgi:hypothetical protein
MKPITIIYIAIKVLIVHADILNQLTNHIQIGIYCNQCYHYGKITINLITSTFQCSLLSLP